MKPVILITGASSGIGYTTAETLVKQGHKVYGAARRIINISSVGGRVTSHFGDWYRQANMQWKHLAMHFAWNLRNLESRYLSLNQQQ